jgi:hypothetical protein
MASKKVFVPSEIISELYAIVVREGYSALFPVFKQGVGENIEYLDLSEQDAKNLLRLADIEMSKALLRYPHSEEDDPLYDPKHEEGYDEIMMGIYEKTYYYIQSEFRELKA